MPRQRIFDECYIPEPNSGCWLWIATRSKYGYGVFGIGGGKRVLAHRYSWSLANGPIEGNLFACHKCDTPACVNPQHLFLGDAAANASDCVSKGRKKGMLGELNPAATLSDREREEIFDLRFSDMTQGEIASAYGTEQTNVSRMWMLRGYRHGQGKTHKRAKPTTGERNHFSKLSDVERNQVYDLRLSDMLQREIGEAYGITEGGVSAIWRRRGSKRCPQPKVRLKGERLQAVMALHGTGISQAKVAKMFGISQPTVSVMWKGR